MRMKITAKNESCVTLSYDEQPHQTESGIKRITREFSRPVSGGYVKEGLQDGEAKQVCKKLSSNGSTLFCDENTALVNIIRKEYRAMRLEEKAWLELIRGN